LKKPLRGDRELARGDRDARHVALAGKLIGVGLHRLLLAAEADGLANESAVQVEDRHHGARLLRLAVRETAEPDRLAQAETLVELRIKEELAALPQAPAKEDRAAPCLARLRRRGQAVVSLIERAEARMRLADERGLAVQAPAVELTVVGRGRRDQHERKRTRVNRPTPAPIALPAHGLCAPSPTLWDATCE
jgi:hypothetical protein